MSGIFFAVVPLFVSCYVGYSPRVGIIGMAPHSSSKFTHIAHMKLPRTPRRLIRNEHAVDVATTGKRVWVFIDSIADENMNRVFVVWPLLEAATEHMAR